MYLHLCANISKTIANPALKYDVAHTLPKRLEGFDSGVVASVQPKPLSNNVSTKLVNKYYQLEWSRVNIGYGELVGEQTRGTVVLRTLQPLL